ncbi:uncharacterized protein LOC142634998 [Castanea sativa]|uniref:uncharacterized protein LOC142634998 n=1 Tax=Castanea sativa TaxID=21020 RepID=UPI003F64D8D1
MGREYRMMDGSSGSSWSERKPHREISILLHRLSLAVIALSISWKSSDKGSYPNISMGRIPFNAVANYKPLPPTNEKQLRDTFQKYDSNGDGLLSKADLENAFKSLGSHMPNWRARRALNHADANGDKFISPEELNEEIEGNWLLKKKLSVTFYEVILVATMTNKKTLPPTTEKQLRDTFQKYDTDGDGHLSKAELENAFKSLGSRMPNWRARRALHHADANGDKNISPEELNEVVKYAAKHGYVLG